MPSKKSKRVRIEAPEDMDAIELAHALMHHVTGVLHRHKEQRDTRRARARGEEHYEVGTHTFSRHPAMQQLNDGIVAAYEQQMQQMLGRIGRFISQQIVPGLDLKKSHPMYGFVADVEWPEDGLIAKQSDDAEHPFLHAVPSFSQEMPSLALLTPAQLERIKQIIRDYHAGFAVGMLGPDSIPPVEVQRLIDSGVIPQDLAYVFQPSAGEKPPESMRFTDLAYRYGRLAADPAHRAKVRAMSLPEFAEYLPDNETPLMPREQQAMAWARHNAGEHMRGAGDRLSLETSTNIRNADAEQRRRYVGVVREKTEENIELRESWRKLASQIGHETGDWSRDLQRLAATEKQGAMQEGAVASIVSRSDEKPEDIRVAKQPNPDACFIAGTMIETQEGPRAIETLQAGDLVLTHRLRWRKVTTGHVRQYDGVLVGIDSVLPYATGNHPFLVDGRWKRADSIERGEHVVQLFCAPDADCDPSVGTEDSFFPRIALASRTPTAMPSAAIEFHRYLKRRDSDVDVEHPDGQFKHDHVTSGYQHDGQSARVFRDTENFALSRGGFLALCLWMSGFLSGFVRELHQAFSFLGRTKRGLFDLDLRSGFELNPSFVQAGLDSVLGDSVLACDAGERASNSLIAGDDALDREVGLGVRHGLGFAMPRQVKSTSSVSFTGSVYNLTVEEDESYFANNVAVHNCPDCVRLHLTAGPGSPPRIFKLSELQANGTNVGKKRAAWKAVIGPVHPWCLPAGAMIATALGDVPIEQIRVGDEVLTHRGRFRRVQRLSQRFYRGDLVILTVGDQVLEATPEHPLLTCHGWAAAETVSEGNRVFVHHRIGDTDLDRVDGPPQHNKIISLALILRDFARHAVPVPRVDFERDSDVGKSKVHVENTDRHLWDRAQAFSPESFVDGALVLRHPTSLLPSLRALDHLLDRSRLAAHGIMRALYTTTTSSSRLLRRVQEVLLGDRTDGDSRLVKSRRDRPACGVVALGQHVDADAGFVAADDVADGELKSFGHYDGVAVISVSHKPFEGTVYNFSVEEDESYIANGIVNHNCGCELFEVPEGWTIDEEGNLAPVMLGKSGGSASPHTVRQPTNRGLATLGDSGRDASGGAAAFAKTVKDEEDIRPHMTHRDAVPEDCCVVRIGDPKMRAVVESVIASAPKAIFHKDVGVTLITTDTPRVQNPLDEQDFAYWTQNEIRIMQTLPIERVPRVIRHELGHSLNVHLMKTLGSVEAVRKWHDQLWAVSLEEGFVSDYAMKLPIENAAEVTRMYIFERPTLMLKWPRQFAFCHRAYRAIFRKKRTTPKVSVELQRQREGTNE